MLNSNFLYVNSNNQETEISELFRRREEGYIIIGLNVKGQRLTMLCDRNINPQKHGYNNCADLIAEKAPQFLGWYKNRDLAKVMFVADQMSADIAVACELSKKYLRGERINYRSVTSVCRNQLHQR